MKTQGYCKTTQVHFVLWLYFKKIAATRGHFRSNGRNPGPGVFLKTPAVILIPPACRSYCGYFTAGVLYNNAGVLSNHAGVLYTNAGLFCLTLRYWNPGSGAFLKTPGEILKLAGEMWFIMRFIKILRSI